MEKNIEKPVRMESHENERRLIFGVLLYTAVFLTTIMLLVFEKSYVYKGEGVWYKHCAKTKVELSEGKRYGFDISLQSEEGANVFVQIDIEDDQGNIVETKSGTYGEYHFDIDSTGGNYIAKVNMYFGKDNLAKFIDSSIDEENKVEVDATLDNIPLELKDVVDALPENEVKIYGVRVEVKVKEK